MDGSGVGRKYYVKIYELEKPELKNFLSELQDKGDCFLIKSN